VSRESKDPHLFFARFAEKLGCPIHDDCFIVGMGGKPIPQTTPGIHAPAEADPRTGCGGVGIHGSFNGPFKGAQCGSQYDSALSP
jgi:hypothetical protein